MKNNVLRGLIAGALTAGAGLYAPAHTYAADTDSAALESYTLDDVIVTASRSDTQIADVPADVTLISAAQIERGNYKSVSDALQGANINVVKKGFAAYPIINGDSRVLVMVDGKKVNWDHLMVSGDDNAVNVDQVPMENVERIEIVRGPNSSLYGERAVSGVINIITKRAKTGKPTGSLNMQLGAWGEKRAGIYVSGGDAKNTIKVSAAHERRRDFRYRNANGDTRTFGNSDIKHTDYTVGFDHIMGSDRLSFDFSRHEADDGYGIFLSDPKTGEPRYTGRQSMVDTAYGVTYMFGSEKDGEGTFLRYYRSESRADAPFDAPYTHKLGRNSFEGQKLWMLSDKNMLVGGFLWARESIHESNNGTMDAAATTKALFAEDDWQLGRGYSLKLGSRYEHHSDYGSDVASHISINKKFGRNTHAYISWGQAVNNPTLKMRYADTPYMKGNPNLKQEKSQTYTLGAESQLSRKWNVSASIYKSKVKDALNWSWNVYTRYYNVDNEDRRGMELSARYRASDVWTVRAAYSYARVESTDTSKNYLSTNTRPNGYNLGLSYTMNRWSADADLNYVTGRSTERFTDARYLTLDLGVNYQVSDAFKVYLKGYNLTNEAYESIGIGFGAPLGAYAMPARHFVLGATYNF